MALFAEAENAAGPSRELIWWEVCLRSGLYRDHEGFRQRDVGFGLMPPDWRGLGPYNQAPEYTRSINTIFDTIDQVIPNWDIALYSNPPHAEITPPSGLLSAHSAAAHEAGRRAASMSLALCAAFCHAMSTL